MRVGENSFEYQRFRAKGISRNSPAKIEVKVEKRMYQVTFYPSSEEECVNVYDSI